ILHVPGYSGPSLTFAQGDRGTNGAVIGYPGGGPERVEPAVVDGAVSAEGRDIYNSSLVTRQIFVLQARVRPGNSGGPLVDTEGRVLGIVFATSATDPAQAYALTDGAIAKDLERGKSQTTPLEMRQYACAA